MLLKVVNINPGYSDSYCSFAQILTMACMWTLSIGPPSHLDEFKDFL